MTDMSERLMAREVRIRERLAQVEDPVEWLIESLILRETTIIGLEDKISFQEQIIRDLESFPTTGVEESKGGQDEG